MNKSIITTIATVVAAMLLWSCDIKDPIYETAHPAQGTVTVTTDWSGMGQGITKPAEYYVTHDGRELKATGDRYTFPSLFNPGSYTLYFYNKAEGITVTDHTATVNAGNGVGTENNLIVPMPAWFFTGKLEANVKADTDHTFTLPMKQQVRELKLVITPEGGTVERIEKIEATLSGVAGSLDFSNDSHGTPSSVAMTFSKITSGDDAGKWSATVHLLGIAGGEQKLSGTITFTGGTPVALPMESNLSTALAQFNNEKNKPLVLGGTSVETPTETGFTVTIRDWEEKSASGTAN